MATVEFRDVAQNASSFRDFQSRGASPLARLLQVKQLITAQDHVSDGDSARYKELTQAFSQWFFIPVGILGNLNQILDLKIARD